YFLPAGAKGAGDNLLDSTAIGWGQLAEQLSKLNGRKILFVDTCHAAGAGGAVSYSPDIVKGPSDEHIVVFSAGSKEGLSQEREDIGHGVFTYALLHGLTKDEARGGEVRLWGLADSVYSLVFKMTNGEQSPEITARSSENYVIAWPR